MNHDRLSSRQHCCSVKRKRVRSRRRLSWEAYVAIFWVAVVISWDVQFCAGWITCTFYHRQWQWPQNQHGFTQRRESSSRHSFKLEDLDPKDVISEDKDDWEEIFQARQRNEQGSPQQQMGQNDLPDLNPFKKQMEKNKANSKATLSASLSLPDYGTRSKKNTAKTTPAKRPGKPLAPIKLSDEDEDDSDSFYLDPSLYQRSRDMLQKDGSLNLEDNDQEGVDIINTQEGRKIVLGQLIQSELESNLVPSTGIDTGTGEEDEEDLNEAWATLQQAQAKPFNASQSEELHRQVFENEQGFLQQSESFRQALSDPTLAKKQAYERRSAQYLERQAKALESLNRNMQEFEDVLQQRQRPQASCSRCNVELTLQDIDVAPQLWMRKRNITALCRTCYIALNKRLEKQKHNQEVKGKNGVSPTRTKTTSPRVASARNSREVSRRTGPSSQGTKSPERQPTARRRDSASTSTARITPDNVAASSSWTEVEDPDTGETFYWNEERDEIRWEI